MRIHELITENQNLDELSLGDVGKKIGGAIGGAAKAVGSVAGGAVGAWDAAKQGYYAGRSAVSGNPAHQYNPYSHMGVGAVDNNNPPPSNTNMPNTSGVTLPPEQTRALANKRKAAVKGAQSPMTPDNPAWPKDIPKVNPQTNQPFADIEDAKEFTMAGMSADEKDRAQRAGGSISPANNAPTTTPQAGNNSPTSYGGGATQPSVSNAPGLNPGKANPSRFVPPATTPSTSGANYGGTAAPQQTISNKNAPAPVNPVQQPGNTAPAPVKQRVSGKVAGQVSQTPNALRKRASRQAKRAAPVTEFYSKFLGTMI